MNEKLIRHELSSMFPDMGTDEFKDLIESIKKNGYVGEEIILLDGQVLDGWHRYTASLEAGLTADEIPMMDYSQDIDPLDYVVTINSNRRHLTTSQRAMIAAKMVTTKAGGNQSANLHNETITVEDAAKKMKVSPRSVKTATKIRATASEEDIADVESGAKTLNKVASKTKKTKPVEPTVTEVTDGNDYYSLVAKAKEAFRTYANDYNADTAKAWTDARYDIEDASRVNMDYDEDGSYIHGGDDRVHALLKTANEHGSYTGKSKSKKTIEETMIVRIPNVEIYIDMIPVLMAERLEVNHKDFKYLTVSGKKIDLQIIADLEKEVKELESKIKKQDKFIAEARTKLAESRQLMSSMAKETLKDAKEVA